MKQVLPKRVALHGGIARALHVGAFVATFGLAVTTPAFAQADGRADFDIVEPSLPAALKAFAEQSGMQLLYRPETVGGRVVRPLKGQFDRREALRQLLDGTDLDVVYSTENAATIRPRAPGAAPPAGNTDSDTDGSGPGMPEGGRPAPAAVDPAGSPAQDLDKIVVTGTRIRGGTTPSPVVTIGRERIQEEGFADLGEVVRSVPQNFGGGQNPGVVAAVGSGNTYNQNVTGGTSLNLRGAGADATLTLLNGRRRSYGGLYDSVDISAIPVEAVERIEIVADGASAIYGSDAIAGVGNVILRRDFEGVMLGTRHGTSTDGGLTTREYSGTTGAVWEAGGLIASVKRVEADPIDVRQRRYTDAMAGPHTLYPGSTLWSGLVSGHQALGDLAQLRLDVLRSRRTQRYDQRYPAFWYDNRTENVAELVSPTVEFALAGDWSLSMGGTWSRDRNEYEIRQVVADTGASTLVQQACNCNESRSYEINAEGPLFAMAGHQARLAVGAGYRTNDFLNATYSANRAYAGEETSRYGYAEMSLPLLGAAPGTAGPERLVMTAALRGEDYDNFGSVVTPKLGLVHRAGTDFTTKLSWGRSFKAPMLSRRHGNRFVYLAPATLAGGAGYAPDATVLITWGANPDLEPERARTMSASLAFHPQALPGLEMELTWFDIDYYDRVLAPLAVIGQALSSPTYSDFVDLAPTPAQQAALLAYYADNLQNIAGMPYDPDDVVAIAYNNYTNAQQQRIRGLDASGAYRFDLGQGRMTVRGSASWLDSTQQNTPGQHPFDLSGTIFYPAKLNARLGGVWTAGGFSGALFAHYTDGVRHHLTRAETASFTTFDATLRYVIDRPRGARAGWDLALVVQNLFNRPPPLYTPAVPTDVPFDSTNYSAIGRFVSVSVARRW